MNLPKQWRAEIKKLEGQIKPMQERIMALRSALDGPYVEPIGIDRDGDESDLWLDEYTLEAAFKALLSRGHDDDWWNYDPQGVSVGGCLITVEQWKTDPRRPPTPQETWDAFVKSLESARLEAGEALLNKVGQAYRVLNGISYTPEGGTKEVHAAKGAIVLDLPESAIRWMLDQGQIKGLCSGDDFDKLDPEVCSCEWCRYSALKDVDREWLLAHGWTPPDRPKR